MIQSATDLITAFGLYQNLQAARQIATEIADVSGNIQVTLPAYPAPSMPLFVPGLEAVQFVQTLIANLTAQLAAYGVTNL